MLHRDPSSGRPTLTPMLGSVGAAVAEPVVDALEGDHASAVVDEARHGRGDGLLANTPPQG